MDETIDLAGKQCTVLVAREFWLEGDQVSPACVIFIQTHHEHWFQIFYDDENCCWVCWACVEVPTIDHTLGDGDCLWPHSDLGERYQLTESYIASFLTTQTEFAAEAELIFDNGAVLFLTNDYKDDTIHMECRDSSE